MKRAAHIVLALSLVSCGSDGRRMPGAGLDQSEGWGDGGPIDQVGEALVPADTAPETRAEVFDVVDLADGAPDLAADLAADLPVQPDEISDPDVGPGLPAGAACQPGDHCQGGGCVDTDFGAICLPSCEPACPKGWGCVKEEDRCYPLDPPSCQACADAGCPELWCREVGGEPVCLLPCTPEGGCPDGWTCEEEPAAPAPPMCLPKAETCECAWDEIGELVPCYITNQWGTCEGAGLCQAEMGIVDCSAKTPGPETCDGQDEDCDGQIDEDFTQLGKPCDGPDDDLCLAGAYACSLDGTGVVCVEEHAFTETCDDVDNDCDGEIDEDFPQKGQNCGWSPLCGWAVWVCSPNGLKVECKGATPEPEVCGDGLDNDCDGQIDEGC